jgi:glycosyltransferase involved in cell wall biosynthesis
MSINQLNVLFVAYYYPPAAGQGLPATMRSVKFIRNLKETEVHVLSVDPQHYASNITFDHGMTLPVNGESVSRTGIFDPFGRMLRLRARLRSRRGALEGAGVSTASFISSQERTHVTNRSRVQRLKDFVYYLSYFPDAESPWLFNAFFRGRKIVRENHVDVIFATGSPWTSLVVGYMISRATGRPLMVDFRDPWVNNPFHPSRGKVLDGFAKTLERWIVRQSAVVSLNTEPLREDFVHRYPELPEDRFVVLPNGFDPSDFSNVSSPRSSPSPNDLVLCHAGFLYGVRDPAPLLEALLIAREKLQNSGKRIRFIQIGRIQVDYNLQKRYSEILGDKTFEVLDQMPYGECLETMSGADVLVNIQPGTKTQVPSKLYDYLGLGRCILTITPQDGALGRMVRKHGFGDSFEPSDIKGMADRLMELLELKREHGRLISEYPNKNEFNVAHITKEFRNHLSRAIQSR